MGIFTLLMVVSMGWFYDEANFASYGVIFLGVIVSAYLIPFILHFRSLKVTDFLRGVVYMFFMTPTYINIISIYAISNIHYVSWGSRPVEANSNKESARDADMANSYKNFRAKFLVIW